MNAQQQPNLTEALGDFTLHEACALEKYKVADSGFAYQLNAFLRCHQSVVAPDPIWLQRLDSALRKRRTVRDVRLFRATWAEDFEAFVRDGVFCNPAYASTTLTESSLGRHFVSSFSQRPIKLVISCPEGANLVPLELRGDTGERENECLLPRCSRYRITAEGPPVKGALAMAKVMGQNTTYHAKDFLDLRIFEVSLIGEKFLHGCRLRGTSAPF